MNRLIILLLFCLLNNVLSAQTLTLSEEWLQTNGDINSIYFFELTTEQGKTVKRVVKQ